ncbi:hypothetical protein LZK98_20415 [Sphingomonas cannabina]|uniref:hypothetical protein n=1 Tax=Sphingomonas cannabina TaxID=2899123 RepID=UPI001F1C0EA0|nr:hypothetical protein [Sphingomonas cannabina]UIJ45372.1 hypothetical protein LZK98_20415 [Sphingomonas cannabina]
MLRNADVRAIVVPVVVIALYYAISSLTGFGAWVNANPVASAIVHVLGVLLFGGLGLLTLLGSRWDRQLRSLGYRLIGVLFLGFAAIHAALLVSGANNPSDLF